MLRPCSEFPGYGVGTYKNIGVTIRIQVQSIHMGSVQVYVLESSVIPLKIPTLVAVEPLAQGFAFGKFISTADHKEVQPPIPIRSSGHLVLSPLWVSRSAGPGNSRSLIPARMVPRHSSYRLLAG